MKLRQLLASLAILTVCADARAADLEAEAWPELDIWINLDEAKKTRLYIMNAYAMDLEGTYNETAISVSVDHRLHPNWAVRGGLRYIVKQTDPPDKDEWRGVGDVKLYLPLGRRWQLTDRNRLDLRQLVGGGFSVRYRNRVMLEKPIPMFGRDITGFGSYEIYYDSNHSAWSRQRLIGGGSVPIVDWLSVDLFYGYHIETRPKDETAGAWGLAIGLYF